MTPLLIQTSSGSWYQVSESPLRLLRWSGHGIRGFSEPVKDKAWQEFQVTECNIPTELGNAMTFQMKDGAFVTTAPVVAKIGIERIHKRLNPKHYGHVPFSNS